MLRRAESPSVTRATELGRDDRLQEGKELLEMVEDVEASSRLDDRRCGDDCAADNERPDHPLDLRLRAHDADDHIDDENEAHEEGERLHNRCRE